MGEGIQFHNWPGGNNESPKKLMCLYCLVPCAWSWQEIRNTVGNIPMKWYKDFDHIGYSLLGQKILKPKTGDELDEFLNRMDNPDYW